MSFLDTLGSVASSVGGFLKSNSLGSNLAKTALLGFALNKMQSSINKQSDALKDKGREVQLNPSTENAIPVVYGSAYVNGVVTDATLSSSNSVLWVCLTLCEKTGNLIDGTPSAISINEIYWDGLRLTFQSDGITVDKAWDEDGNSVDWGGLIKIYPFNNGSEHPTFVTTEPTGNSLNAYQIFPNWTTNHQMNNLVFVLVAIVYNSEKGLTGLGNMQFKVTNSMKQPGDVLFDYMTNLRYGAGIPEAEINKS